MLTQFQPMTLSDMLLQDVHLFFRSWTCDPLRVGAIAPSGPALAAIMTDEVCAASAPVIELGPGTGVFTRALLARGIAEPDITLVESGSDFVTLLERRFPRARVLQLDAAKLSSRHFSGQAAAGVIISGLPLLSMSPRKVMAILSGAFDCLREGGAFYQFTYGARCPVRRPLLDRLGLKAVRVGRALANVPPATVYRITRRNPIKRIALRSSQ
jgi:phosphatidylethanolamine/phosphatidyl-N-methylethanolamine N-methyltransferase